jgi:hypothetical protein
MPAAVTAGTIMDVAASLLNDTAKQLYTYTAQTPYLQLAYEELQDELQQNNIAMSNNASSALTVPVGTTSLTQSTTPAYPSDMISIQEIKERLSGSDDGYLPIVKVEFLPQGVTEGESLGVWSWQEQTIKFVGATTIRQIIIEYIAAPFSAITGSTSSVAYFQAKRFLEFRTAALCAMYIGENPTRAGALENDANKALENLVNLGVKEKQVMPARRRPFLAGYKAGGSW